MKKLSVFCTLVFIRMLFAASALAATSAETAAVPVAQNVKVTILSTMLADRGIGEWGFAALVEVDGYRVLFDTGARPETVLQNAKELNIDLSQVTDVILSHFHDDHTGGLLTLRRAMMAINPKALSRVHVGQGIFEERFTKDGSENVNAMLETRKKYEASGGVFVIHPGPDQISPGVWLTGPVKRRYPEQNWSKGAFIKTSAGKVEDNVQEDTSLVINGVDGLTVITGCGHAGIANILAQAHDMLPQAKVNAVVGGLHLFAADEKTLQWTADKMKQAGVRYLLAGHCTGIEATFRLRALLGLERKAAVVAAVGSSYSNKTGIDPLQLAR